MKQRVFIFLLAFSCFCVAAWVEYATMPNGDVYFFDDARVEIDHNQISVWNRVRYKRPVMAASSYQSLLKLDCSENSETVLQSTFYNAEDWNSPAMATNKNVKPETSVKPDSTSGQLINILCKDLKD